MASGYDEIEGLSQSRKQQGAKAWEAWQRYTESQEAAPEPTPEETAIREPAPTQRALGLGGLEAPAAAALASDRAGLKTQDDRAAVMLAMQAEALARLELPTHREEVIAGVRAATGTDEAARLDRSEGLAAKRTEGQLNDRDQQLERGSLVKATDYVYGIERKESRTAEERLADHRYAAEKGLQPRRE